METFGLVYLVCVKNLPLEAFWLGKMIITFGFQPALSAEKPKAGWNWAEGDDKNVGWREFPEFFSKLETGEILGDENGFVLILPSEANKKLLQEYKDKFKGKFNSHIK
ncbi:MAG: hypothetical protein WKF71_05780 [Pyrinomonadaceae bacterium]